MSMTPVWNSDASTRCPRPELWRAAVGTKGEPSNDFSAGRLSNVNRNGTISEIEGNKKGAPRSAMGPHATGVIAAVDTFNLNHVGAQIGQDQGGHRSSHDVA